MATVEMTLRYGSIDHASTTITEDVRSLITTKVMRKFATIEMAFEFGLIEDNASTTITEDLRSLITTKVMGKFATIEMAFEYGLIENDTSTTITEDVKSSKTL